jgi:hypothetical protein
VRFVHSLVKTQNGERVGWCAPIELGESSPHDISFVIPIDDAMDDRYLCEISRGEGDRRFLVARELIRGEGDSFFLDVEELRLWFTARTSSKKDRPLPYIGKLKHADFTSRFAEIALQDASSLDRLYQDDGGIIVGCDPFAHYSGIETLMQTNARSNLK